MSRGFTIVQLLIVIAILGLLTAVLFPVFARAKEGGNRTTCISNSRQLGQALALYANDQEDKAPVLSHASFIRGTPVSMGWAGMVFPYVKNVKVFQCPSDATTASPVSGGATPSTVSYAMNSNLPFQPSLSSAASQAKTVLLFEVVGNTALITSPDEEFSRGHSVTEQMSASGDGTYGGIFSASKVWTGPGQGRFTRYATGVIDNAGTDIHGDNYQGEKSRHADGSTWLALDGHAAWTRPLDISAGITAKSADAEQSASGCRITPGLNGIFACAEGTAVGKHKLTFSLR